MTREEPYFKKCCFVIPLSLCLQTWAIIKLVTAVSALGLAFVSFAYILVLGALSSSGSGALPTIIVLLLALMTVTLCIDVAFNVILMVAICKKNRKILKVFYIYDIYVIVAETVVFIALVVFLFINASVNSFCIGFLILGITYILLDICTLLAIKSEMIKLRNKEQYDFMKIESYPSEIEDIGLRQNLDSNLESSYD